jgi:hypothetical protein
MSHGSACLQSLRGSPRAAHSRAQMYAITHAATALAIRHRVPEAPLWPLLIGVQAVELVWIVLSLAGIEHPSFHDGRVSLDFLPYSHSVTSGLVVAALAYGVTTIVTRNRRIALALAVAVFSHIVLDILQHQRDILLFPAPVGPRLGTGLLDVPWLDFAIEVAYCLGCAWLIGGRRALYVGMVILNVANLPTMFQWASVIAPVAERPRLLPVLIAAQILVTWLFVARFGRTVATKLGRTVATK